MVGTNERTVPSKDEVSLVKLVIKASFRSRFKLLFVSSSDREKANFSRIRFYKFWRSCLGERCELFFKAFCEDIDLLKLFITLSFLVMFLLVKINSRNRGYIFSQGFLNLYKS